MEEVNRVLCLISAMNTGGAETFLMKLYRNMDRSRYQMDFCVTVSEKGFYDDEIEELGGKIYRIPRKTENLYRFKSALSDVVKNNNYKYVLRITSNAMGFLDLKIAKKAGAECCIARSSNSSDGGSMRSIISHKIGSLLYRKYIDIALAPSDLAASYTFGKKAYESGIVHILHNAVDLKRFHYDEEARKEIRTEFSIIPDAKVFGHVGRFAEQKNHIFLAEIFKEISIKNENAVFLLVGDGELRAMFEKKIEETGIKGRVIFAGVRADIPRLLSAMDVFVFPSFYEGMPNTVIEAQATGLPCVISDTITNEADITGLVQYMSLDRSPKEWADLSIRQLKLKRENQEICFREKKYDIESTVIEFENILNEGNHADIKNTFKI